MEKNSYSIKDLRIDIMNFNNTIFNNVKFGLFQRQDKNISFRIEDRFAKSHKVGLNLDFNLMKNNIDINDLDLNIIIRKDSGNLFKTLENNNFSIEKKGTKRDTYDVPNKNLDYIGEIHIKNLDDLKKLLSICYKYFS